MNRKIFYITLLVLYSVLFLYTMLQVFVLVDIEVKPIHTSGIKFLLSFAIIFYESLYAKKTFRIINNFLFPVVLLGYVITIMHWPYGRAIFISAIIAIMVSLILNAIKI